MSQVSPHKRLRIVLVSPRIPFNVGSIARTCLALGAELHLVRPFGFVLNDRLLDRGSAGHYRQIQPRVYRDEQEFWDFFSTLDTSFFWATSRGQEDYAQLSYSLDTTLIFGNEDEGVPSNFWNFTPLPRIVSCRIPTTAVRCLNLAISVGVMGFEVRRQWDASREWKDIKEVKGF